MMAVGRGQVRSELKGCGFRSHFCPAVAAGHESEGSC